MGPSRRKLPGESIAVETEDLQLFQDTPRSRKLPAEFVFSEVPKSIARVNEKPQRRKAAKNIPKGIVGRQDSIEPGMRQSIRQMGRASPVLAGSPLAQYIAFASTHSSDRGSRELQSPGRLLLRAMLLRCKLCNDASADQATGSLPVSLESSTSLVFRAATESVQVAEPRAGG